MKKFIEIKGKVVDIVTKIWPYLVYLIKFIAALALFRKINTVFGGSIAILGRGYVPVMLAGVSVFLNLATIGVFALIYTVANMLGVSWVLALVTLILGTFFIGAALYFNRKTAGLVWVIPLLSQMGIPYAAPMACGLFAPVTSCGTVLVGTAVTYYLRAIIGYLPNMADEDSTITALDIFLEQVISNSGFYILIMAMVLMTAVTYLVGLIKVRGAKIYALVMGLVVQVLVQYAGKLFFNTGTDMGAVMKGSWYVFLIGLVLVFFTSNGNFNRIEKVRFEDDDYIYHVRAIPKAKIAKAHKKVKNVTRDTSKMDLTANLGAVVEVSRDKKRPSATSSKPASKKRSVMDTVMGLIPKKKPQPKKKPRPKTGSQQKSRPQPRREQEFKREAMMKGFDEALVIEEKEGQRENQNLNISDI